jgi:archaemetzincin
MSNRDVTTVDLHPLGGLATDRARVIAARLSRRVAAPCRVVETTIPAAPVLSGRDQGDADALLASLESTPGDGSVRLGLTAQDLAIPIFTFVFGRARSGGHAAVVSLARLDPAFYGLPADEEALIARTVREALHELGHLAQLPHCDHAECLMRFAGSVEKADLRGAEFCPACEARLPEWLRPSGAAPHPPPVLG